MIKLTGDAPAGLFFRVTDLYAWPLGSQDCKSGERPIIPRTGVIGHDEWVIAQALATALVALEQLPPKVQPKPWAKNANQPRRPRFGACSPAI